MAGEVALPPLRQDLALTPGPVAPDGSPSWTLHDPGDNRFYQLSWPAFEILSRWQLADPARLIEAVNRETTLHIGPEDLQGVVQFLLQYHLVQANGAADSERLSRAAKAHRHSPLMWLVHHYLFFRIPLLRPMPFLQRFSPYVDGLFSRRFLYLILGVALYGLYLVSQQWEQFVHTFAGYADWQGALGIGIALSFAKGLHELGHAFAAYRHGCRVPSMGIAFLVMWPVLYTDTNEAWKLDSRQARLQIGAAGIGAEMALAALATLLWNFLPDGPVRAGVFLLATSTWLVTLTLNLSPFMRFDGYFLLSDLLNLPNLHERSFALGRWRLREWLFGLGAEAPEYFPPARQRFLILFAFATWLYRLILFLSIALLVYHFFFKLLGIVLLAVELGFFIALPVWREMRQWWLLRKRLQWNPATRRSLALVLVGFIVVVFPWKGSLRAPAIVMASQAQSLYTPAASQLKQVNIRAGQAVKQGQVLLELHSPELRYQLAKAVVREQQLRWQLEQQSFDTRLQESGEALRTHWQAAQQEVGGLQALEAQLILRAPFDGIVASDGRSWAPGMWFTRGEELLTVVNPKGIKVEAYVEEDALLSLAQTGLFVADESGLSTIQCRRIVQDPINLVHLEHAVLASPFGGPIPARREYNEQLLPLKNVFRVRLDDCSGWPGTSRELAGTAHLGMQRESLFRQAWRLILALWQRESTLN